MIKTPKVVYGLLRAYALPQSGPTSAIRGAPSPLLANIPYLIHTLPDTTRLLYLC